MTYAIAEVIYGTPITRDLLERIRDEVTIDQLPAAFLTELAAGHDPVVTMQDVIDDLAETGEFFEQRYSGSADEEPLFIGVPLCTFDETAHVKVTDLQLSPTAEQYATARERLEKLPEAIRRFVEPMHVWIFWSTS